MKRLLTILFLSLFINPILAQETAHDMLWKLFDDYQEYNMRTYPTWATYEGDHRFDDRLTDNSLAAITARYDSTRMFLAWLEEIPYDDLLDEDKLNYDLFKDGFDQSLDAQKFHFEYMPIGQQSGLHIGFPQIVNVQPLNTPEEYDKYLSRLRAFPVQIDNVIEAMRMGMQTGMMPPKFIMEQTLGQMENVYKIDSSEQSPFYVSPMGIEAPLNVKESLDKELKEVIANDINTAYMKLHDFVRDEYLPLCRTDAGIWSLPNGKEIYEYDIKNYTTTDMTADEIFNTGMSEVNRIKGEMEKVKDEIGYSGTLDEFNEFLKTDPQFYYTDKDSLMQGFKNILSEMDSKLPSLFGTLPQAPLDVKEIEEFRAKNAPAAYYYSAPEDRSRPGYFYVNTYDLSSRPKYTMTALALHEGVPGHHLQITISQERENLPKFRKGGGETVFVEGWGLYAEHLGYESGMYEDLYQKYGALTFEMWRACRLVVDAGMHSKKWTREEALDFLKTNTPGSDLDMASEIDRYISWPGQALAYKIGELKFKELRKKAEDRLGDKFDVREFHDIVLKNGALPIKILEKMVEEWLKSKGA
ncbi:MAG: DUF885 domain-containing protein [Ignavibacteriae bacterium]|nr:DUF885 domain-containing protein [Ignavibacteriota bacterium]MCB9243852.1 DUF885 domain-containing protein [Ignavibacteriales bacterium]